MVKDYSVREAIKLTGCTRGQLNRLDFDGKIEIHDGAIPEKYVTALIQEKEQYIGLLEYALSHTSGNFNGKISRDREKLRDEMELHDYYGAEVFDPDDLLSGTTRGTVYFLRSSIPLLDENLVTFFELFGMSEEEKINKRFKETPGHMESKKYLRKFLQETGLEITPATTEFVEKVLSLPIDIGQLTDKVLQNLITKEMPVLTKNYIIQFFNYVRMRRQVNYSTVARKKTEKKTIPAYMDDTYMALAKCFFNAKYIYDNQMIEKAMNYHIYAETWLYLTLFFVCGWRAADVCRGWIYPQIDKDPDKWGICLETLDKDILEDNLPDSVYENICHYVLKRIQVSGQIPGKTASHKPSGLMAVITPQLHMFYGLLTLIGESHRLRSGDGHMQAKRTAQYQSKVTIKAFFGQEAYDILHGQNIQSRRLNKDYLQGTEEEARRTGCGGLMASAVASYARNHTNLNTLESYLKDHNLTAESADVVLYCMLERGCFGFESYNLLISAYPDAFRKLTLQEQNTILALSDRPLEIENKGAGYEAAGLIQKKYQKGDDKAVLSMLKAMFEISQNRGKGKDDGIYCLRRARKEACQHPECESCLASCCKDLVFTRYGYLPLLKILKKFKDQAANGNKRAREILYKVLIPRYQNILNTLMNTMNMTQEERNGLKLLLEEELHG